MAIGAGLASQLGAKKETTYGTPVTVDKFFEYNSEGINFQRNRVYSKGLKAGRTFQSSARVATTTRGGDGPVAMEVGTKGFGFWPDLLTGDTVTPVQIAATTAYTSTFNIGASDPTKSATVQVGKPGTAGTVHPFTYEGCMVTEANFSCEKDGFLEFEAGLDVQDRLTATALATASYPSSNNSFHFGQCTPTVNSVAVTDKYESVKVNLGFARKTDRWHLGSEGAKSKPITNAFTTGSIEFGGDFKDLTDTTLFDAATFFPVVLTWTHTDLAGVGNPFSVTMTFAACQMEGQDPNVAGEDVLSQGITCTVLDNGTNPPVVIAIVSTDTTAW